MRGLSSPPHVRTIGSRENESVPVWKILAASLLLLVAVVPVAMAVQGGPEPREPRPEIVLPAAVEAPRVVLRPAEDEPRSDRPGATPGPKQPGPSTQAPDQRTAPPPQPDCGVKDDDDGDDDDDDGILVVHPCPGAVGDDEDDDDRGGDDDDD